MKVYSLFLLMIIVFCFSCNKSTEIKNEPSLENSKDVEDDLDTEDENKEEDIIGPEDNTMGTIWKLAGIVDVHTGTLKTLRPEDCEVCYTLAFDTVEHTATAISINRRWKLDLLDLDHTPPYMDGNLINCCELYKKNGYCYFEAQDFAVLFLDTKSYSITKDECRLFVGEKATTYLSFIPHEGDNPNTSHIDTRWKFEGVFNIKTDILVGCIEPDHCADCYTITFLSDEIIRIKSTDRWSWDQDITKLNQILEIDESLNKGSHHSNEHQECFTINRVYFTDMMSKALAIEFSNNEMKLFLPVMEGYTNLIGVCCSDYMLFKQVY